MGILNGRTGQAGYSTPLRVLDSCSFTWVFDEPRRRFRRVPRGAALDVPAPAAAWTHYDRLELNEARGSFAVFADAEGTHVFRCWLHRDPCPRCAPAVEERLDPDEMRWLIKRWKSRIGIPEGYDRPVSMAATLPAVSPLVQTRRRRTFSSEEP
jgi:hypothetical protein